eukprot:12107554-Prorocentrum_lima.AAC.1
MWLGCQPGSVHASAASEDVHGSEHASASFNDVAAHASVHVSASVEGYGWIANLVLGVVQPP